MAGSLDELDSREGLAHRVERHAFDRLIMLADGVFAIALTLAALEMRVPSTWDGTWPGFLGVMTVPLAVYVLSFAVISVYWMANRRAMARLGRVDGVFTAMTLVFLALVALVPAANRFLIDARGAASKAAFLIYFGMITLLGLVQAATWGYAAYAGRLTLPEVTGRYKVAHLITSCVTPPAAYVLSILIYASRPGVVRWSEVAAAAVLLAARRWLLGAWVGREAPAGAGPLPIAGSEVSS